VATGTITSIRPRGFGFIGRDRRGPRTEDVFFHRSAVEGDGFEALREGQRVSFEVEPDPRDPSRRRAVTVRPLAGTGGGSGAGAPVSKVADPRRAGTAGAPAPSREDGEDTTGTPTAEPDVAVAEGPGAVRLVPADGHAPERVVSWFGLTTGELPAGRRAAAARWAAGHHARAEAFGEIAALWDRYGVPEDATLGEALAGRLVPGGAVARLAGQGGRG
jgi:CspA family cold shock protein